MNKFTINGTEYKAKPFDFNLVCDLEDMGISLKQAGSKPMSMARAYFGLCAEKGKEFAGKEMEAHIIGGGKFDDIIAAMSAEMEKSDFFQSLNKGAETEDAENQETETAETAETPVAEEKPE